MLDEKRLNEIDFFSSCSICISKMDVKSLAVSSILPLIDQMKYEHVEELKKILLEKNKLYMIVDYLQNEYIVEAASMEEAIEKIINTQDFDFFFPFSSRFCIICGVEEDDHIKTHTLKEVTVCLLAEFKRNGQIYQIVRSDLNHLERFDRNHNFKCFTFQSEHLKKFCIRADDLDSAIKLACKRQGIINQISVNSINVYLDEKHCFICGELLDNTFYHHMRNHTIHDVDEKILYDFIKNNFTIEEL